MKKAIYITLIISAVMLLMPLGVIGNSNSVATMATVINNVPKAKEAKATSFLLCNTQSGEVIELKAEDYIFGVVAAEMPALYESEALKAQAVAAYTFACCRKAENSQKSYDITDDPLTDQSYINEEKAREKWGDKADEYTDKIKGVINEVEDYMITYDGKPINAVYHAISSGKTEDCKDIWGNQLPYLKSVPSEGDKLADNYVTTKTLSTDQLKEKLSEELEFLGSPENYFGSISRTDSGTVTEITVCNKALSGSRIRSLLDLRSSNFEVSYAEENFTFTVYGYGHGVGMSQNGANYMAKQGSSFQEILKHYYTDCKVEKVK